MEFNQERTINKNKETSLILFKWFNINHLKVSSDKSNLIMPEIRKLPLILTITISILTMLMNSLEQLLTQRSCLKTILINLENRLAKK